MNENISLVPTAEYPQSDEAAVAESDELLCEMGNVPPLLEVEEVVAFCRKVEVKKFGPYSHKMVFQMQVLEPQVHWGVILEMFCPFPTKWKGRPPVASKLYRMIMVATGGTAKPRRGIPKGVFLNKIWRCSTAKCGKGPAAYTKVDQILEKVAGACPLLEPEP